MIRAVYDCNVILSAVGWNGSARACLKLVALREVFLYATDAIWSEYDSVIPKTLAEELPTVDPEPKLAWLKRKIRFVEPSPLGKARSRDASDDIYLAAAMSAQASYVVTYDGDLLVLRKPFGIETIRPAALLRRFKP